MILFANEQIVGGFSLNYRVYNLVVNYFADFNFESLDVFGGADSLCGKCKVFRGSALEFLEFGGDEHSCGSDELCDLFLHIGFFGQEVIQQDNCQMIGLN